MRKDSLTAPSKIKIGPLDFTIRWYDRIEENRDARYGYFSANDFEIGVSDRLPPTKKAETFMHEVIHALWYILGLKSKESEETVSDRYGIGLAMIARDNPEVFQWWLSLSNP